MFRKNGLFAALGLTLQVLAGCGGEQAASGAKITTSVKLASDAISPVAARALRNEVEALSLSSTLFRRISEGGQVTTSGLESLKYYIKAISLCEELTISNTAFSNAQKCIGIYSADEDPAFAYDSSSEWSSMAEAARLHDDRFIDLMDADERARLTNNVTITAENIGSYTWGTITWAPVLKAKANIEVGSDTFRTLDGVVDTTYVTTAPGNFRTAAAAEEAVVVLGNGGNWFKAETPLEITQADIDAGTNYAVDLTFNPEGFFRAYSSDVGGCGTCQLRDSVGNQFMIPALALTPVMRRASETTMVETYVASVTGTNANGTDNFDLRIELYYTKEDPEKKIYGVLARTHLNESSNTFFYDFSKISYLVTAEDETLELQSHTQSALISGLVRQTEIGEGDSATIHCSALGNGGYTFHGCGELDEDPTSVSFEFVLESVKELE